MQDEQNDVKQSVGEEANNSTASVEEPKATEEPEVPTEPSEPTGEEVQEEPKGETEDSPKKGANSRIRELNARAKSAEEKAKSLEERLAELTGRVSPQVPQAPYQPQIDPGTEYSPDQFKQEVMKSAISAATLVTKQSEAVNRINTEAQEILRTYPELDPENENFNKDLSDAITEATLDHVKNQPYTASPKKFVEKMMKPFKRAVSKNVGQASENIARQVSQAALRPTGVTTSGEKPDSELSIAELEKKYGVVNV